MLLRIRKITDARDAGNRAAIAEAQAILRAVPGLPADDIDKLPEQLENPLAYRFKTELLVAERDAGQVAAVALLSLAPDLRFAYLDLISAAPGRGGSGIGAALYERVRDEARTAGARGLYFECLPDDPELSPVAATRRQNAARLRFYERFGARPIAGTAYETPLTAGGSDPPYLVFDGLGRFELPPVRQLRRIVRAILERKYGALCPPAYIALVLRSIRRGQVGLRAPRYAAPGRTGIAATVAAALPMVVNADHDIHHVRERGYVEAPIRISAVRRELERSGLVRVVDPRRFGERYLRETHDGALVDYIRRACAEQPAGKSLYPYVFPIRNPERRPRERSVLAGYWCIDTFTPLNRNVWPAARGAVDCALTAAALVADGAPAAYALVRPPGHHAEYRAFGGFCYFNNAAIAAQYLSHRGRVAVLDIDYHHGNGTQDIFYRRDDVLTVSVHGHPAFAYPYFSGFAQEIGEDAGVGYNLNLPLPETITPAQHRRAVARALRRVRAHDPDFLVLALGFDTAQEDPTGTWSNRADDFESLGALIGECGIPLVIVQEGGYRVRTLGVNARHFFTGLTRIWPAHGARRPCPPRRRRDYACAARSARAMSPRSVACSPPSALQHREIASAITRTPDGSCTAPPAHGIIVAERAGAIVGYACYGAIPGSARATPSMMWWSTPERSVAASAAPCSSGSKRRQRSPAVHDSTPRPRPARRRGDPRLLSPPGIRGSRRAARFPSHGRRQACLVQDAAHVRIAATVPGGTALRPPHSRVFAHRPGRRGEHPSGDGARMVFERSRERVVPAIEIAEQGDGRHDLDHFGVIEVRAQVSMSASSTALGVMPARKAMRSAARSAALNRWRLSPTRPRSLVRRLVQAGQIGHVGLAIPASRREAGRGREQHLQA